MKKTFLISIFLFSLTFLKAQDPIFTQSFSNPLYLNPAYAGSAGCSRLGVNYRDQWPSISANYLTGTIAYDQYIKQLHGGIGIQCAYDNAGDGILTTQFINLTYAYNLKINDNLVIRPAISLGFRTRKLDLGKLTFGSPFSYFNSMNINYNNPSHFIKTENIDVNAGLIAHYKNLNSGFSIKHLTQPDEGFFSVSKLPYLFTIHSNYIIKLNEKKSITPGIVYNQQNEFKSFNPSIIARINHLRIGASTQFSTNNVNCFSGIAGFVNKRICITYSYDLTVSKLSNSTGGTHEISTIFKFNFKNKENFKISMDDDF